MKLGLIPGRLDESLEENWNGTLERVVAMGYEGVELSAGLVEKSGFSPTDCRANLAEHGLEVMSLFSGWGPFDNEPEAEIERALALGCYYMVWGWSPAAEPDRMQEVLPIMHKAASMVRAAGMTLLYHNHDHEFLGRNGDEVAFDWLMGRFSPELFQSELDIGWVHYGGFDVVETIEKYAGRCPILHIRDVGDPATRGDFVEIGSGMLDLARILETGARVGGSKWAIVEYGKKMDIEPFGALEVAAKCLRPSLA